VQKPAGAMAGKKHVEIDLQIKGERGDWAQFAPAHGGSFHVSVGGGVSIGMQKLISVSKLAAYRTHTHKHKQAQ